MNFANTGRPLVEKVLYLVAAIETNKRKKNSKILHSRIRRKLLQDLLGKENVWDLG